MCIVPGQYSAIAPISGHGLLFSRRLFKLSSVLGVCVCVCVCRKLSFILRPMVELPHIGILHHFHVFSFVVGEISKKFAG